MNIIAVPYEHGGDKLKKPIRTTLDEFVLKTLKEWAFEQDTHVNNIIERLVGEKLYQMQLTRRDNGFDEMEEDAQINHLHGRIERAINDIVDELELPRRDTQLTVFIRIIAILAVKGKL